MALQHNGFSYFVPFSSPKESDYIIGDNGLKVIKKSIIPIIRMTTTDTLTGEEELKGTLKLNNMIPVPPSELLYYNINEELDLNYKNIVTKEYKFIKKNQDLIKKKCKNNL